VIAAMSLLLAVCAGIYALVGFGGGSAYLALLTLFGFSPDVVVPIALCLNILVVSGGAYHFTRAGHLRPRLLLPFLLTSMPAAFVGARLHVDPALWKYMAAAVLLLSAAALALRSIGREGVEARDLSPARLWRLGPLLGGALGLMAGVVGVGGGIFLAPVLLLLGWGRAKQIAAAASVFILLNSLSGLAGHLTKLADPAALTQYAALAIAVLVAGQIGSRLGAYHVSGGLIRGMTAIVLVFAGSRLFLSTPVGAASGVGTFELLIGIAVLVTAFTTTRVRAPGRLTGASH
jgi:uncharacterized protein